MSESILDVAKEALEVYRSYTEIGSKLDVLKKKLRDDAAGSTKKFIVEGFGEIHVSSPSPGSTKSVFVLDESVLAKSDDLKKKLLEKGVIIKKSKSSPPSAAKVTISPNV